MEELSKYKPLNPNWQKVNWNNTQLRYSTKNAFFTSMVPGCIIYGRILIPRKPKTVCPQNSRFWETNRLPYNVSSNVGRIEKLAAP
jgi:hypothetical protein